MNKWDNLGDDFYQYADEENLGNHLTDNILTAWPVFVQIINDNISKSSKKTALDFGCGTGGFCKQLYKLEFDVTGIDVSHRMIASAKKNLSKRIRLIVGDSTSLETRTKFDLITSIQVFQFIENIEQTISNLDKLLKNDGLLIFTVYNPKFILKHKFFKLVYKDKYILHIPKVLNMDVFIRDAKDYETILEKLGYKMISEQYPEFTDDFLKKYDLGLTKADKEFMVLAFRKNGTQY